MPGATYVNTIQASLSISVSASTSSSTTLYTVPADSHLVFQCVTTAFGTACSVTIDGRGCWPFSAITQGSGTLYAGPGAVIGMTSGGTSTVQLTGCLFVNSV